MHKPSILIADDDAGLIRLLRTILQPLGIQLRETYSAISALTMAHDQPPDLVILDVNMPAGNGLAACEMLTSDAALSKLPVIIFTGENSESTLDRCRRMNAHYIRKGSDGVQQLKQLICKLLSVPETETVDPHLYVG